MLVITSTKTVIYSTKTFTNIKNHVLFRDRLAGQGSSALEVSGQSISKCSKNNKSIPLNSTQCEFDSCCTCVDYPQVKERK